MQTVGKMMKYRMESLREEFDYRVKHAPESAYRAKERVEKLMDSLQIADAIVLCVTENLLDRAK